MDKSKYKEFKNTSSLTKEEIMAMLEKWLSDDVIYTVDCGFNIETKEVALNGMLGHTPGTYTTYGFKERFIGISW